MCGFVGRYSQVSSDPHDLRIETALKTIEHRGPDSQGSKHLRLGPGYLTLGFRRLAIIDLSDQANQPFASEDHRFSLVFNGEIYNYIELRNELKAKGHRFKTSSDTEVLLAAWIEWGIACVDKLVGMFSFALTDNLKSELYCVRDAFGIKPFYFHYSTDSFSFASEIEALRVISGGGLSRNEQTAQNYLLSGDYDFGQETFFQGISSLLPGHFIKIELHQSPLNVNIQRWWKPTFGQYSELTLEQATEKLREEFLASVRLHLRSDVKIATALSGGLDSSAIVGAIRYLEPKMEINTFSFVGGSGPKDESVWIAMANSQFGAQAHLVEVQSSDFVRDSDEIIRLQGEPFGSSSIYAQYRVFQKARENGVKVLLDGQGADELFAGYYGYPESYLISKIESMDLGGGISFIHNWGTLPGRNRMQLSKSLLKSLAITYKVPGFNMGTTIKRHPDFFRGNYRADFPTVDYPEDFDWVRQRLRQRLFHEQSIGMLPSLLRHADRNSMHWSIESRVPFLTPSLSTLGLGVRENFLVNGLGVTKAILRGALEGIVDPELINRKDKVGFETPQESWTGSLVSSKLEILDGIRDFDYLDEKKTQEFLTGKSRANSGANSLLWRTYNLIRWNQLHFDK